MNLDRVYGTHIHLGSFSADKRYNIAPHCKGRLCNNILSNLSHYYFSTRLNRSMAMKLDRFLTR